MMDAGLVNPNGPNLVWFVAACLVSATRSDLEAFTFSALGESEAFACLFIATDYQGGVIGAQFEANLAVMAPATRS